MIEIDPVRTQEIKTAYLAGTLNFIQAMYELFEIGHTAAQAQKLVYELVKEKHNDGPRDN